VNDAGDGLLVDAVNTLLATATGLLGDILEIIEIGEISHKVPKRYALMERILREVWPEMQYLNARWRDAGHNNLFRLKLVLALLALMATEWRDAMAEENGSREEEDKWGRKESRGEGEEH
jgi:hypothetical protein